jgi:hypothetical protein
MSTLLWFAMPVLSTYLSMETGRIARVVANWYNTFGLPKRTSRLVNLAQKDRSSHDLGMWIGAS